MRWDACDFFCDEVATSRDRTCLKSKIEEDVRNGPWSLRLTKVRSLRSYINSKRRLWPGEAEQLENCWLVDWTCVKSATIKTLALPSIGRFDTNTSRVGPKNWGLAIFNELLCGLRQSVPEVTWIEVQCLWFLLVHLWFPVHVYNLKDSEMAPKKTSTCWDLSETRRRSLAVSAPDQQAHWVHAQVRLPRFILHHVPSLGLKIQLSIQKKLVVCWLRMVTVRCQNHWRSLVFWG